MVVASDKPEKTRLRINGDSGMEPKENSDLPMKSPVLPLLKIDAIRNLLLRREPFKEGVKVQMRPGSPFMCRVNPPGWSVGWSRAGSFSPLISDACCVSNEEEEERKRGRKKASVGDKLIMEGGEIQANVEGTSLGAR